jgi:hypothetical protein
MDLSSEPTRRIPPDEFSANLYRAVIRAALERWEHYGRPLRVTLDPTEPPQAGEFRILIVVVGPPEHNPYWDAMPAERWAGTAWLAEDASARPVVMWRVPHLDQSNRAEYAPVLPQ